MSIAEQIVLALKAGGERTAIEFNGATLSWAALYEATERLDALLSSAGLDAASPIGLLARNRLEPLGGFVAILSAARALVLVNIMRPPALVAEEVYELRMACLLGSRGDVTTPELVAAAKQCGTMLILIDIKGGRVLFETVLLRGSGPFRSRDPGTLIEIQTSGTTGKPKRISVAEQTVEASLRDGVRTAKGATDRPMPVPKSSPTLLFGPLVHTSGTFNTLMSLFEARPIVLFEKFDACKYRDALVRHRPKFVALPPTAMKMLFDSEATREDFSGVLAVRAGTSPLSVDLQDAFEEKFGVPVLTTYGATEFMGAIASWTLDDHRRFGRAKRGSVGRAGRGVQLRVVDAASGQEVPSGAEGILEAKLAPIDTGGDWIRTTDLARIDEDGFLYILGRTDDAIIRGGFKVMAEKVADVIRKYAGVFEAIVVGRPDERLGEVPVAVVEPYPDHPALDTDSLRTFMKERLAAYEVPVEFHIVERLPRTVSDKVSRPQVHRLLDQIRSLESSSDKN